MVRTFGNRGRALSGAAVASLLAGVVLGHGAFPATGRPAALVEPAALGSAVPSSGTSGTEQCTSNPSGSLGPYTYSSIVNSNGYNTYVGNNMWGANPGTTQTVCSYDPGNWTVVANAGPSVDTNTGVQTYPDVQQLFNDWTGSGWAPDATPVGAVAVQAPTLGRSARSAVAAAKQEAAQVAQAVTLSLQGRGWNNGPPMNDTPLSALHSLSSTYSTTNPSVGDFEAAYDIWLDNTPASEVMIWVYNVNRGTGGATVLGHTTLSGVPVTVMRYGSGELIVSLDNNQAAGTIDILQALQYLQSVGLVSSDATLAQVDFGWEICNTAGQSLTFSLRSYSLRGP